MVQIFLKLCRVKIAQWQKMNLNLNSKGLKQSIQYIIIKKKNMKVYNMSINKE